MRSAINRLTPDAVTSMSTLSAARGVAALHQNGVHAASPPVSASSRRACAIIWASLDATGASSKRRGFGKVWRQQQGTRQQPGSQHLDRIWPQQALARTRDNHRVEHDPRLPVSREGSGNGLDNGRVRKHADLDRADLEILRRRRRSGP